MIPSLSGVPLHATHVKAAALRERIANVEAVRDRYQRRIDGNTPGRLPLSTLADDIARCDASLARLRKELIAL